MENEAKIFKEKKERESFEKKWLIEHITRFLKEIESNKTLLFIIIQGTKWKKDIINMLGVNTQC